MTELPEAVGRWLDEVLGAPVHVDGLLPGATTAKVVSLRSHGGAYVMKLFSHAPFVAGFEAVDRWAETEQARRTRLETFIREALRDL